MQPQLSRLDDLLSVEQAFLLGDQPSLADLTAYHVVWFLETIGGPSDLIAPHTRAWVERVKAIGHGNPTEMSPTQALDRARSATPAALPAAPEYDAPEGVELGDDATVSPLDEDSPATGRLIYYDDHRIVLRCTHQRVGEINVHFPRIGYRVRRSLR